MASSALEVPDISYNPESPGLTLSALLHPEMGAEESKLFMDQLLINPDLGGERPSEKLAKAFIIVKFAKSQELHELDQQLTALRNEIAQTKERFRQGIYTQQDYQAYEQKKLDVDTLANRIAMLNLQIVFCDQGVNEIGVMMEVINKYIEISTPQLTPSPYQLDPLFDGDHGTDQN